MATAVLSPAEISAKHRILWIAVVLVPVALSLYMGLRDLRGFWDDGAITAAYARTYADSGRIALTPNSTVVEGMSSLTWFLLLTAPRFFSSNPDAILVWMKCASAISLVLTLAIFFRVSREQLEGSERAALACTLLLAFSYTSMLEVTNGMEMNLAMLLVLLLFSLLTRSHISGKAFALSWFLATLLLATRFESPLVLFLLAVGAYLDAHRRRDAQTRRRLLLLGAATLLSFAGLELWRHHEFGLWMPNTVYAKEWQPYSRWHGMQSLSSWLSACVIGTREILILLNLSLVIALAAAAIGLLSRKFISTPLRHMSAAVWMLVAGAFVTAWITGNCWGYNGRMIVPVLPFLLIAIVALCRSAQPMWSRLTPLLGVMIVSQAAIWLFVALYLSKDGGSVEQFRETGLGAEAIRRALDEPTLVVMLPDVGGSSLYAGRLRILDSSLLSNPELARKGWSRFGEYFHAVSPDLFETHGFWADYQHAYGSDILNNYSIVGANGSRFFVRNDLFARLLANKDGQVLPVDTSSSCLGGPVLADNAFSRTKKTCLVLRLP